MKIPKKIQIMGEWVNIEITPHIDEGVNGESNPEEFKILINKSVPPKRRLLILLHELIHYCNALLGYQRKQCDKEEYVEQLSGLLNQVIPQLR